MIYRALMGWQIAATAIIAAGWGFWLWRIAGRDAAVRRTGWLWWGIAGFLVHTLLLQTLVYLNLPLRWTAWAGFAVGGGGCVELVRWRLNEKSRLGVRAEGAAFAAAIGIVMVVHLAIPLLQGPSRYFGNGRYDQANYVVTAQFLMDEPFYTDAHAIGLRPWLTQPLEKKEERITQSVVHGALAAVSGGDAQEAYAVVAALFTAMTAAATFGWLRGCAVPGRLAALGGVLAAVAAGLTHILLDGFLSQVATVFVVPALAGVLWPRRAIDRPARLIAALLLAFVFGAYTEIAAVAVGLVACLVAAQSTPVPRRIRDFAVILGAALVLNPGYTMRLAAFLALQWSRARDPLHLASYFPDAGTWPGFGRVLIEVANDRAAAAIGLLAATLFVTGVVWQPRARRIALAAVAAAPILVLVTLRLQRPLPAYPFAKLAIGFTPLWVGGAVLAGAAAIRRWRRCGGFVHAAMLLAIAASLASTAPWYHGIRSPVNTLAILESNGIADARAMATTHPERHYVVAHDDPLVAQWLCYFARRSTVYVDRRHLGDRVVASESFAFRRLPGPPAELWQLDPDGLGRLEPHEPAVAVSITGERVAGETDRARFYLVGDSLRVALTREPANAATREAWLDLALTPLPGVGPCDVEFVPSANGPRQVGVARLGGWMRFRVALKSGRNDYTLRVRPQSGKSSRDALGILQAISVEPVNRRVLSNDPVPATVVE